MAQLGALCLSNLCATKPFIESENLTQDLNTIQELLNEINKDFEKLSVELQLQYMVAKNKLAKLKHEAN